MDKTAFEKERLELFARHGFEGRSRWVTGGDRRRIYAIERDGKSDCPIVMIHGGLSEASEWSLMASHMPGHVIISDRPGCGISYHVDYTRENFRKVAVDYMLDLVDGLGAEQVDLVGNSMGGYFSIVFALAHPERVRRLVLVGAPAGLDRAIPWFLRLWGNPLVGPMISKKGIKNAEALRSQVFKSILVAHAEAVPTDLLETMVDSMSLPGVNRSAYTMLRAATTLRGIRGHLLIREDTTDLQVPTAFLWGDRDAFAPPSSGEELAPRMLHATVKVLRDVGHLPHVEVPELIAEEVTRFFGYRSTAVPARANEPNQSAVPTL